MPQEPKYTSEYVTELEERLREAHDLARKHLKKSAERQKILYNTNVKRHNYVKGDLSDTQHPLITDERDDDAKSTQEEEIGNEMKDVITDRDESDNMPAMIADDYLDNSPITPDITRKPPRLLRKPKLREKIACKQVQTRSTRSRRNIKVPLKYQDFVEPIMEEDNYKYTCKDCGKGYSNQKNLRRHRNQVHENKVKYFRCSVVECEKTYFRHEYLLLHLQSAHQLSREEEQAKRASHETGNRSEVKSPRKKAKVQCNVHGPVASPSEPSTSKQSENSASASEQDTYVDFIDLHADSSEFNPDVDRTCSQESIPETDKEDTFYEHDELLDSLAEISNDLDEQAMDTESLPGPAGLCSAHNKSKKTRM
ncbi:unnamed protein product [Mytilus coruscus]|uniref:C2H2-type domain-containing protein n=1 Tax=Mytilus coruscus TaxID=42192 RepID=A0A6J8DJZ9_MYTCO|nr:unnamed protein product [Mytilus coruscus]